MKKAYILLIISISVIFDSSKVLAQSEFGLYFSDRVWQTHKMNPARLQINHFTFSFPSPYLGIGNSGFTFNDLVRPIPNSDATELDVDNLVSILDDQNTLRLQAELDAFMVGLRVKNWQFTLAASAYMRGFVQYPQSLVEFAWNGNSEFIGQETEIAPDIHLLSYSEIALGTTYSLNDKLTLGLRLKYITGLANVHTEYASATVYNDPEYYQMTLSTDVLIHTSMLDPGDPDNIDPTFEFEPFNDNQTIALDLGLEYKLNEKFSFGLSATNLGGAIKWKQTVSNFRSEGEYTFEGLDASDILTDTELDADSIADEISDTFEFQETNEGYTTNLPVRLFVSGTYHASDNFRLSGLFASEWFHGNQYTSATISANKDLGKIFSGGISYTLQKKSYDNLGLNVSLRAFPFLWYLATDNIPAVVSPRYTRGTNFRFGMNLVF